MDRTPAEASGRGRTSSTATGGGGGGVTGTGNRREKERTSSSSTVRSKVSTYQGNNPNEVCYSVCGTVFKVDRIYKDLKPVGKGSYGIVCSALNSVTGESVAIKKVAPVSTHVMDAKHVLREIRMMRYLGQHENIITLKDLFLREVDDELYIVMELLDSDLHRIIQSKQALSEAHHRFFMHQLLKGLKFLHDHRIIHRDLKPGNLLVTRSCELRITDFGLARARPDEPMTEHVVTRWYRPPELMLCPDGLYTYAVDMWSVGCIFAELLGRKPLFPGKNFVHQLTLIFDVIGPPKPSEVAHVRSSQARRFLESISAKTAVPFTTLYPSASPEAIGLLERLLVYDPHSRLTVDEALAHPYFDPLRGVEMQRAVPPPLAVAERLDFSFEKGHIGKGQLKALIVKEVESFRRERRALLRPVVPSPDDDEGLFVMPGSSGHSAAAAEQPTMPSDVTAGGLGDPQAGRRAAAAGAIGQQVNTRSHAAAARQSAGNNGPAALGNSARGYGDRGGKRGSLSSRPAASSEQLSGRYSTTPASASPNMDTHMTADVSGSCDSSSLPPTKRAGHHCCPPSSSSLPGREGGLQRSWGASSLHSSSGGLSASTASRSHYAPSSQASMGPLGGAHSAGGHFGSGATLHAHARPSSSSATTALPSANSMRYGQCASQATVAASYHAAPTSESVNTMNEQAGGGHMDTSPPNTASTITTVTGGSNTRRRGSVGTHSGGKKMMVVKNGSAAAVMMDMGGEGDTMEMEEEEEEEEERENMIPDEGDGMEVDGDEVSMLTEEQKQKIEANRLAALALRERKARERAALLEQQQRETQGDVAGSSALAELAQQGGFCDSKESTPTTQTAAVSTKGEPAMSAPAVPSATASAVAGGCEVCGISRIDENFLKVFEVRVCGQCKNEHDDYRLMSKGDVAAEFLLQDGTIAVLPYIERSNPRHAKFQAMKLYIRKQAREKSYDRWGGEEELEKERERRKKRKYEAALQKTNAVMKKKAT